MNRRPEYNPPMRLLNCLIVLLLASCAFAQTPLPAEYDGKPIYKVGSGVTPPKALNAPGPSYSPEGQKKHVEGLVLLQTIVGTDGKAHEITVVKGLGYGLDEEAVRAVKTWAFDPAKLKGKPVAVRIYVEINFRLR